MSANDDQPKTLKLEVPARFNGDDVVLHIEWSPWGALAGGEFHLEDITQDGLSMLEFVRQANAAGAESEADLRRMWDEGWRPTGNTLGSQDQT